MYIFLWWWGLLALPSQDDAHYVELSEAAASVNQQISIGWSPPPTPVSSSLVAEDILALKDLINIGVSDGSQVSDGSVICYYCLFPALSLQQQH